MASGTGHDRESDAVAKGGHARAALIVGASALAVGTLALSTLASSAPASAKGSPKALTLKAVAVPSVGKVLATSAGLTLYRYTVNPSGQATCTGACAKIWPPLLLPKGVTHLKAPSGVKGLSVVHVAGGRLQVFFHHQALYTFVSDKKKGQASGQGVENDWFAVLSNGKSSASASAPTTSSPATGGSTNTPTTTTKTPATTKGTTPPVTKTTSPPSSSSTTQPPTTPPPTTQPAPTTTTTQPPTTTTTSPPGGGVAF
jgi:predicted lipoprotein with Yx(FWY)xxD motif